MCGGRDDDERADHTLFRRSIAFTKGKRSQFEAEARLLLAVKLYELGKITTGVAARLAGIDRVAFMFALDRFGSSPIGVEPDELVEDVANA